MDPEQEIKVSLQAININFIDPNSIKIGELIGEFNNKVYEGLLKTDSDSIAVAIKVISKREYYKCIEAYVNEAKKFNLVPEITSVPKVLGVSITEDNVYIVKELLPGAKPLAIIGKDVSYKQKINYLLQLTGVVSEFHKINRTYQNLIPINVLISNDKVYLVDFGGTKLVIGSSITAKDPKSKPFYMPPEYFNLDDEELDIAKEPASSFDIWSLGCIISETLSGIKPWTNINWDDPELKKTKIRKKEIIEDTTIMNLNMKEVNFPIPDTLPDEIKQILNGLLILDASKRMTVQELYEKLDNLYKSL